MKLSTIYKVFISFLFLGLTSCQVENLDDENRNPKTDYTSFNYVLATEDASTADITRFFSFNINGIDSERSEEHTSELQSRPHLVCRLLLEKKKKNK